MSVEFRDAAEGGRAGLGRDATSVTRSRAAADAIRGIRRIRYARRQTSSSWLLDAARDLAGVDARSGEVGAHDVEDGAVAALAPRVAKCGWAVADAVGVHHSGKGSARFSGLASCGSVWSCPCCSAIIRARRSEEVQRAADWWESGAENHRFLFVTFTARHRMGDPLRVSLSALTEAFTRTIRGAPWKRFAERHGIRHMIKAVEVTLSWNNGWHAHLHVLFFTDYRQSRRMVGEARGWLSARWADMVVKAGGRRPDDEHGVNVRSVQNGRVVALYTTKLQEHEPKRWAVGQEMTRIDSKKGRLDSMVPFDLLDDDGLDDDEETRHRQHWAEYVEVTKGRRALTWSRGLKEAAGIEELDDESVVAEDNAEAAADDLRVLIRRQDWRRVQHAPDLTARILELVETGRLGEVEDIVPCVLVPPE